MKNIFFVGSRVDLYKNLNMDKYNIIKLMIVKDSHLHKYAKLNDLKYDILLSKKQLIDEIEISNFDLFISNGCPYIIPVSKLKKEHQIFINIHPGLLPEIRGNHPINASLLYNRNAGATCHIMDDGIDTGSIISKIEIPLTNDLDLGLLYNLSFDAEVKAFKLAENKNFIADEKYNQNNAKQGLYFTRDKNLNEIKFIDSIETILAKVRAFNIKSQRAYFIHKKQKFFVRECIVMENSYLLDMIHNYKNNEIIYVYDENMVFKKDHNIIMFKYIIGDMNLLSVGSILE